MPADNQDNLDRWRQENRKWHRALLLWAMQEQSQRSQRAVARAMGVSEGSVRNWARARRWKHRAAHYGDKADQVALDMYREHYMADFGTLEIPHVAGNIVRPLGALDNDDPVKAALDLSRERVKIATGQTMAEVTQQVAIANEDNKRDNRMEAKRHVRLVDGALGLIAKKMKALEIRVSVRDIPVLLECREKLVRVADGTDGSTAGRVVESSRVKYAKETGGDLLEAMYQDAEECVLILGALKTRKEIDLVALSEENATEIGVPA